MATKTEKEIVKKTSGKLGKLVGAANLVLGVIPDTVEIVGKITDKAAPIVDKHLERNHEYKKSLIAVPNLVDVEVEQARAYLENIGLQVMTILAKPNKKYAKADSGEVVAMSPRGGKVLPATLVKLYYVNDIVIELSKREMALPDVVGLPLDEAHDLLEKMGYHVSCLPTKPNKKYAETAIQQVLYMSPKPQFNLTSPKKGSLIKLYYLDEMGQQHSQLLFEEEKQRKIAENQRIKDTVRQIQKIVPIKKNK
ncbi:PASTA domain-containing protein [Streptococcus ovis]|uniref:PASTA domain-containing protein n=1 Tax=Streptococcus ovis TaxID=82806 RepID=UPI0003A4D6A5|nr:PASTA domain-containing protein [Streptococcus ovis]